MSDKDFSPRPDKGKWFWWTRRPAVWVEAEPWYGNIYRYEDLKWIKLHFGKFWFLSVDVGFFHFYIGYKPITLDDPQFYWRKHPEIIQYWSQGALFVQKSARKGWGAWK